jgi:hypothetical protein
MNQSQDSPGTTPDYQPHEQNPAWLEMQYNFTYPDVVYPDRLGSSGKFVKNTKLFLISNFYLVLNVVCFILGDLPASVV